MVAGLLASRFLKRHDLSEFTEIEVIVIDKADPGKVAFPLEVLAPSSIVYLVVLDKGSLVSRGLMSQESAFVLLAGTSGVANDLKPMTLNTQNSAPLVSIIICSLFRRIPLMCITLASVLSQDYQNFEVIVVDNLGDPLIDYREVFGDNEELLNRIRIVSEPKRGVSKARNTGVETAAGEFIAFLDDDEEVTPSWLSTMMRHFEDLEECAAVTGPVLPRRIATVAQLAYIMFQQDEMNSPLDDGYFFHAELRQRGLSKYGIGYLGGSGNLVIRKNAFRVVGGFDPVMSTAPHVTSGEDLDFFLRLLDAGYGIVKTTEAPIFHELRTSVEDYLEQCISFGRGATALVAADVLRGGLYLNILNGGLQAFARKLLGRFTGESTLSGTVSIKNPSYALAKTLNRYASIAEVVGMFEGPFRYLLSFALNRRNTKRWLLSRT